MARVCVAPLVQDELDHLVQVFLRRNRALAVQTTDSEGDHNSRIRCLNPRLILMIISLGRRKKTCPMAAGYSESTHGLVGGVVDS